jgi:hypothetical protein
VGKPSDCFLVKRDSMLYEAFEVPLGELYDRGPENALALVFRDPDVEAFNDCAFDSQGALLVTNVESEVRSR